MNSIITNTTLNDIFNYSDDSVIRVIGNTDQPWFNGKDIATILGYTDTDQAIRKNVDEEDKLTLKQLKNLGLLGDGIKKSSHKSVWINESGLYSLIFGSRLPSAKQFKRWVTSEVLPSIRKKGQYVYTERIKELEEKQKELESQRILSDAPHIKITDRLINQHHFISRAEYNYIYKSQEVIINERIVKFKHPDFNKFKVFLLKLSKKISKEMKEQGFKLSNITLKNRTNLYTREMYENYIDDIIDEYIMLYPLESLDIDWTWYTGYDYSDDDDF